MSKVTPIDAAVAMKLSDNAKGGAAILFFGAYRLLKNTKRNKEDGD